MSIDPNKLHFAGDISIDKISIISSDGTVYNVKNQLISIQLFEDLFTPFMTGILTFKDSLDFMNGLPMIGQELLDVTMYTPSLKDKGGYINTQFYITELKNREFVAERSVVYEMMFISKEAITDCNTKLSKSYSGKASEVAKQVMEDKLVQFNSVKKLNIEESKNNVRYVSNYWSPVRNLNYIAEHAINKTDSPSYLFFENRDGFNFGSIETLASSPVITQEFNYNSTMQAVTPYGSSQRDVNMDYQRITLFSVTEGFNLINRLKSGMVSSVMFSSDVTTKRINVKTFDVFKNFKDRKHLNEFPLINNKIPTYYTAKIFNVPRAYENFSNTPDATNAVHLQRRVSEILQGSDFKININVPGRTDYTVGQVVRITTFQIEPIVKSQSNKDQLDMIFSGKYLVSAINHYITKKSHECSMELIKDSYITSFTK